LFKSELPDLKVVCDEFIHTNRDLDSPPVYSGSDDKFSSAYLGESELKPDKLQPLQPNLPHLSPSFYSSFKQTGTRSRPMSVSSSEDIDSSSDESMDTDSEDELQWFAYTRIDTPSHEEISSFNSDLSNAIEEAQEPLDSPPGLISLSSSPSPLQEIKAIPLPPVPDDTWSLPDGEEINSPSDEFMRLPFDHANAINLELNISSTFYNHPKSSLLLSPSIRKGPLYPESNLLAQLASEAPPINVEPPIQVFCVTTPQTGVSQQDLDAAKILTAEPDHMSTFDVHIGFLKAIRGSLVEGIRRIGFKLATPDWRALINERPNNDPVRFYFNQQCFLFRFLEAEGERTAGLPELSTQDFRPLHFKESNPLLEEEEIKFLRNASIIFRSNRRLLLSDAINAVLDMRFRRPEAVSDLLQEGYFNPSNFNK
jgi:hypothetical protein